MTPPRAHPDAALKFAWKSEWLGALGLFVLVVLTYSPVWWAGYLWDDDLVVTSNPCIVGPLGFKEIWTTSAADICPLTLSTFWLEHGLWGLTPLPYHLVNVLLHGSSAVVLWRVLRRLDLPGAWLGAALWALHPVEVESVAWIAELKNTESGLFFLLSILFFLKWFKSRDPSGRSPGYRNYSLMLLFALMAMLSKSSTVVLPLVFCLCAWWLEGRWNWRNLKSIAPVFIMSLAAAAVSVWTQKLQVVASNHAELNRTWPERVATAGDAVWFYLGKILWPYPLINIYPRWQIDPGLWTSYLPLLAVILLLFALWMKRQSLARPFLFTFAYFLVALLPVLGLVTMTYSRFSFVADHFQYLASMGPLALLGAGIAGLLERDKGTKPWLRSGVYTGLILIFALLSWNWAWAYQNKTTIWVDTLRKNPACWIGYNNLGNEFLDRGQLDKAIVFFRKAIALKANDELAHNNLGVALNKSGHLDEAFSEYQIALKINPNYPSAHMNLGNALSHKGETDEAIAEYHQALKINPFLAEAYNNMGNALMRAGRMDEAIAQFNKALDMDPHLAASRVNLGNALLNGGHVEEAIAQFEAALKMDPHLAKAHLGLGDSFLAASRADDAIEQFQACLAINPTDAGIYTRLGKAFLKKGDMNSAIGQFKAALQMKPDDRETQLELDKISVEKGKN